MADKINIVFDAKMEVSQIRTAVQELQRNLSSMSMPKNLGEELESRLGRLNRELDNFETASSKAITSLKDAKTVTSSFEKLSSLTSQVKQTLGKLGSEMNIDPNKFFPKEVEARINTAKNAIAQYNKTIEAGNEKLTQQKDQLKEITAQIAQQEKKLKASQSKKEKKQADVNEKEAIAKSLAQEARKTSSARKGQVTKSTNKIKELEQEKKALQDYEKALNNLTKAEKAAADAKNNPLARQETKDRTAQELTQAKVAYDTAASAADKYLKAKRTLTDVDLDIAKENNNIKQQNSIMNNATTAAEKANQAFISVKAGLDAYSNEVEQNSEELRQLQSDQQKVTQEIEKTEAAVRSGAMNQLAEAFKQIGISIDPASTSMEEIQTILSQLSSSAVEQLKNSLNAAGVNAKTLDLNLEKVGEKESELRQTANAAQAMANELDQVKNQLSYYFSLVNVAQLLRRAFQDVVQTVKELDAVMTETAVVTDFSVGDMWDKLPEYTEQAKALGVATRDLYAATTLYYQQGLDTNASMAAGIETMKMAKIAGMEASAATDAMTAALRGFNMEVNETNAQRVNDVYSKLAAITASDTEEIATAMSKTASIASSVGAEFENIAVFLAQAIETTRESADSIGTAMKTVLARFNELTKDPAEIGEIEGEIVDANKVEAALRSVGIALRDTNGQFREADKVLLEVAGKWDSMSTMQQRYIATQAAGSRQQSRFIAMMSDYNRTIELQSAAYSANGASQAQYEKTLESLDSKLAKLKNTWNEFILGIANSSVIKGTVDILSNLLNIINKMTNAPGILGGVLKSLLAFSAFKGIRKGIGLFDGLMAGGQAAKAAAIAGDSASAAFLKSFRNATAKAGKKKNILGDVIQANKIAFDAKGVTTLSKEIDSLTASTAQSERMIRVYNASGRDTSARSKALAADQANLAAKQEQLNATLARNAAVTQLSNEQKDEAILLASLGASNDLAGIAAKNGLTAATIAEYIGVESLTDATEEQINAAIIDLALRKQVTAATVRQTILTKAQTLATKAQTLANNLQGKSFKDILLKLKGAGKTAEGAMSGMKSGISSITGTLGNLFKSIGSIIGSIGAMLGPILIAVAAIGVAFAAWKIYDKYFSLEARMNAAAEATERAEKAAEAAKEKYDSLLQAKDSYEQTQDKLKELTKGTQEWEDALLEANNQVIDLLKNYPKLAKYIQSGEDGNLTISTEGWRDYLEEVKQSVTSSQIALGTSRIAEERLKIEGYENQQQSGDFDISKVLGQDSMGRGDETEKLYNVLSSNADKLIDTTSKYYKTMSDAYGLTQVSETRLSEIAQEYIKINNQIDASAKAIEGYVTTIENALSGALEIVSESDEKYRDSFSSGFANTMATQDAIDEEGKRLRTGHLSDSGAAKELVERGYTSSGDQEKDLVKLMSVVSGMTQEDIIKQFASDGESINKINDTKLAKEIAKYTISGETTKNMNAAFDKFSKLTDTQQKYFAGLISENGEDLTQEAIEEIKNYSGESGTGVEGYLKEMSEKLGYESTEDFAEEYNFKNFDAMVAQYENNINKASNVFSEVESKILRILNVISEDDLPSETKTSYEKITDSMTASALENFGSQLLDVQQQSGQQGVEDYINTLAPFLEKITDEDDKSAFLDALTSLDITDIDSIESLKTQLEDVGNISTDLSQGDFKDLENSLIRVGKASRTFEPDKILEFFGLASTVKKKNKDKDFEYTDEEYNQIIGANIEGAGADQFVHTGTGYMFIGDPKTFEQNAQKAADYNYHQSVQSYENDIRQGKKVEDWLKGGTVSFGDEQLTRNQWLEKVTEDPNSLDISNVRDLADTFGIKYTNEMTREDIADLIEDYVEDYYDPLDENRSKLKNLKESSGEATQFAKSTRSLAGRTNKNGADTIVDDTDVKTLKAQAKALGVSEKAIEEYDKAIKAAKGDSEKVKKATTDLLNAMEDRETVDNLAESFTDIDEVLGDYGDHLEDVSDTDIQDIGDSLGLTNMEIDGQGFNFVQENLALIKKAVEGDVAAFQQLQSKMAEEYGIIIDATSGYVDFSAIIEAMGVVDQEAIDLYNSLIEAGSFETEEVVVEKEGEYTVPVFDPVSGLITGFTKKTLKQGETMTVLKPTGAPKIREASGQAGGGGGGGGGSSNKYESKADKYHNLQIDIDDVAKKRNKAEEEYADLLEDEDATLDDIRKKEAEIIGYLEKENELANKKIAGRREQIKAEFAKNATLSKYAYFDEETGQVKYKLDSNGNPLIDSVTDEEVGKKFDEGWDKVTEWSEDALDQEEYVSENEEQIAEYRKKGKNDLDDSFDTLEKIEKIENDITNLQAERNILMEDAAKNSAEILENYRKEKELLEQQLETQLALNKERQAQHAENLEKAQRAGVMQYITDMGNGQFTVDQTELDKLNQTEQDFILEWLDKLNESGEAVQESTEGVNDASQALEDFKNELEGGAFDFYDQVRQLVVEAYQRQIDNLTEVSDSINEANSKIIDGIQETLDLERQERENEKTEESLGDKQAQLAYLKMDTSGANQLAIKQLEEQIADESESYTDQLIDQKISELSRQNEKAFEQRQLQIELMQKQLQYDQDTGKINEEVQKLISTGVDNTGKILPGSELQTLFAKSEMFKGLTQAEIDREMTTFEQQAIQYLGYLTEYRAVGEEESGYSVGDDITEDLDLTNTSATATVDRSGVVKVDLGGGRNFSVSGVTTDLDGNLDFSRVTGGRYFHASDARKIIRASAKLETLTPEEQAKYDLNNDGKITAADARLALRNAAQMENISFGEDEYSDIDFFAAVALMNENGYDKLYDLNKDSKLTDEDLQLIVDNFGVPKSMFAFKTGGIADFTGPAWLDGTKAKPELILNARDTENFIQLKDILSQVLKGVGTAKADEKTGDMYYEIHIEVDKLTNDYDVDDVAKRVQQIITQDANYRNVNLINRLR